MTNWRTSLFGLVGGAFNLLANGMNWKQVLVSIAVAGIGLVAKDGNKSNSPTPLASAQRVN